MEGYLNADIYPMNPAKNLIFVVVALQLTACAGPRPDLKRLYEVSSADYFQHPVILVPGAFSTRLKTADKGIDYWPGTLIDILFSNYDVLAPKIDPDKLEPIIDASEAYALFDQAIGVDFYGKILRVLEHAGGYSPGQAGKQNNDRSPRYYVFIYDWRQDMVKTAVELDKLIEQIRTDYHQPDLKVDIIAYSMGANLVRYYIRYGKEDVLDRTQFWPNYMGAAKVRKSVMLGAPNLGSISALQNFMKGYNIPVGLGTIRPEIFATLPSAYQILPHPDRDWMITPEGNKFTRDLYAVKTWRDYQWSIFDPVIRERIHKRFPNKTEAENYLAVLEKYFDKYLTRAKNFHRALSVPMDEIAVRYIVFGGDCELTPARCLVENVKGKTFVRLYPEEIVNRVDGVDYTKLMLEPGDGRVTKPSLLARNALDPSIPGMEAGAFPLAYSVFLCVKHSRLTGNISFQDNLLNILLLQETTEDRINKRSP